MPPVICRIDALVLLRNSFRTPTRTKSEVYIISANLPQSRHGFIYVRSLLLSSVVRNGFQRRCSPQRTESFCCPHILLCLPSSLSKTVPGQDVTLTVLYGSDTSVAQNFALNSPQKWVGQRNGAGQRVRLRRRGLKYILRMAKPDTSI